MDYFSEIFGLVTKNDPTTENGGLFFAHYLVLKKMLGLQNSPYDNAIFNLKMNSALVENGLYKRSSYHTTRTVSQDELTGFTVASFLLKTSHRFSVWNYLAKHFGNYPATGTTSFYNPGSYYAWAVLGESKISFLLAPWYTLNLLISTNKNKQNTSSKLIYMSELYVMKDLTAYGDFLWQYYEWRMQTMYGEKWVAALIDIYFGGEDLDHPLRELSRKI